MKKFVTPLITTLLLLGISSSAQVKHLQPKVYTSIVQKVIKGTLADATEEITHHKVIIKVLLNKFEFVYPNHEKEDVLVKMTESEWIEGAKETDYSISSHPLIKEIYFETDRNKIWLDFKNGETVIYTLNILKKKPSKK